MLKVTGIIEYFAQTYSVNLRKTIYLSRAQSSGRLSNEKRTECAYRQFGRFWMFRKMREILLTKKLTNGLAEIRYFVVMMALVLVHTHIRIYVY